MRHKRAMMRDQTSKTTILGTALAGLLLLSGCGGAAETNLQRIDNQIAAADIDPALTSALEDEIMVDPALVGQSQPDAVRHPERPLSAPYPMSPPPRGGASGGGGGGGNGNGGGAAPVRSASAAPIDAPIAGACGAPLEYGPQWAERLPAAFPAYPGGRLTEAAGNNAGECRMRVVTFTTPHGHAQVLGWYRDAAARAGFSHEHQVRGGDHVLGGFNGRTDGAYYLIVTPVQGGSEVALIVNHGR